jgi:UDP-N-acetylglucosamine--N-acetylmuramyl-(pentapeptide) pyrophosphoryl-undecaprenol N-acetylglucosamine transferase
VAAPRIVFYAVNGLGLGHVTRLLGIARALRRLAPNAEMLFLTTSEADGVIFREGFAAVKLPSKTIREDCGLRKTTYLKMVQTVTWNTIAGFDPDVLVVDTYPSGSFEELIPVLRWRQKNVFVFREQRSETFQSSLLLAALPLYDRLIVPHDDVAAVGELHEPGKALAVGPILIRDRKELLDRARARATLGLPKDVPEAALVLYASFGGGGDPEALRALDLTLDAVAALGNAHLVYGAGPLMRAPPQPRAGLTVLAGRYPMLDLLPAFDGAIAAAGYNTVHELMYAGIPSVIVPFGRILDDQERRARELAAAGACLCCEPLTAGGLGAAVRRLADPALRRELAKQAQKVVGHNGAEPAARAILELA